MGTEIKSLFFSLPLHLKQVEQSKKVVRKPSMRPTQKGKEEAV
jgi:hypothetical protein